MRAQQGRILIVEDDQGVARLERLHLERAGFAVATAATHAEALDLIAGERWDLTRLQRGWDAAGFDDLGWDDVTEEAAMPASA